MAVVGRHHGILVEMRTKCPLSRNVTARGPGFYRLVRPYLSLVSPEKPVGRVPWGRKMGFVMTWTGSVGKRSGARGAMSVSASNSGGRVS